MTMMERVHEILRSPTASDVLKDAVCQALTRDPIDALNDAEMVLELCRQRCEEIQARQIRDQWIGQRVAAGTGDDHDTGYVVGIDAHGDAVVAWESQVTTPCPLTMLQKIQGSH